MDNKKDEMKFRFFQHFDMKGQRYDMAGGVSVCLSFSPSMYVFGAHKKIGKIVFSSNPLLYLA